SSNTSGFARPIACSAAFTTQTDPSPSSIRCAGYPLDAIDAPATTASTTAPAPIVASVDRRPRTHRRTPVRASLIGDVDAFLGARGSRFAVPVHGHGDAHRLTRVAVDDVPRGRLVALRDAVDGDLVEVALAQPGIGPGELDGAIRLGGLDVRHDGDAVVVEVREDHGDRGEPERDDEGRAHDEEPRDRALPPRGRVGPAVREAAGRRRF